MDRGTLEITKEEHDLLIAGLRKLPITGNLDTLPSGLEKIMGLVKKIQGAFEEDTNGISRTIDGAGS